MTTALHALSDRAASLTARQPRAVIGGSILCGIVLIELAAALTINGLLF